MFAKQSILAYTQLLLALTSAAFVNHIDLNCAAASTGPQPGDVYREFAVHNGGNDWRVTDPQATASGAQKFLPNPVLKLSVDDLDSAVRAEVMLDRWGGHLKTTSKRIRFNGHDWLHVPELATVPAGHRPEMYYSQDNPVVSVPLDHLKEGINLVEGSCATIDDYNWGQWGIYSVILRVYYDPQRKPHATGRITEPASGTELSDKPRVSIASSPSDSVARIDVLAHYHGYDENGDGVFHDWHQACFQSQRGSAADISQHVGTAEESPFQVDWDTGWVPDQKPNSVQLVARIQNRDGVWYVTPVVNNLTLKRTQWSVKMYPAQDVPERFGVRVGEKMSCRMTIPEQDQLNNAEKAVLALRTWHGWDGHHHPLKLNDAEIRIDGNNHHYDFDRLDVPVSVLRSGENTFQIRSDTDHHMLEVLWPGPALIVRYRVERD